MGPHLRSTARAADGYELAVTRFPAQGDPWATLLVAGAMGVRQDFYAPLARFFAENGVHVLTFDYRGMGFSRPRDLAALEVDVGDWAAKDMNAMIGEARRAAPHLPHTLVGHSLGGQLLGALADNEAVRAALTVTAGSGWYRLNDRMPVRVRLFWFVMVPLLTPLVGYFPGKALHMVGDLPKGVAYQWRKWCLDPDYLLCEGESYRAAFDRVKAPIRGYSFEDDPILTRAAVDNLHGFYRNARVTRRHVAPADVGAKSLGHFGFFAESSRATLWQEALDWLRTEAKDAARVAGMAASESV
jgi:predicted alpha/beta hydrolase